MFAGHSRCSFDYLTVREDGPNGKLLGTYCGKKIPDPIASSTNILWVNMITDKSSDRAGFRATWDTIDNEPEGKT